MTAAAAPAAEPLAAGHLFDFCIHWNLYRQNPGSQLKLDPLWIFVTVNKQPKTHQMYEKHMQLQLTHSQNLTKYAKSGLFRVHIRVHGLKSHGQSPDFTGPEFSGARAQGG